MASQKFLLLVVFVVLCVALGNASLYSGPLSLAESRHGDGQNSDLLQQRLSKLWQMKQLEDIKEKLKHGSNNQEAIFRSLFS